MGCTIGKGRDPTLFRYYFMLTSSTIPKLQSEIQGASLQWMDE
jgi:hypothetical protein